MTQELENTCPPPQQPPRSQAAQALDPDHYKKGGMEVWDITNAYDCNFNRGSAVKYILRAGEKPYPNMSAGRSKLIDLSKAIKFLENELRRIEGCKSM